MLNNFILKIIIKIRRPATPPALQDLDFYYYFDTKNKKEVEECVAPQYSLSLFVSK